MIGNFIIADSGATKTIWTVVDNGEVWHFNGEGINPVVNDEDYIFSALRNAKQGLGKIENKGIFFYGAGCGSERNREIIRNLIKEVNLSQTVTVETDLLGAARSLLADDEGLVAIMGTGINTGFYDGVGIALKVPSLGYLFGDEGSGAWLGKEVLASYFHGNLGSEINERIEDHYGFIGRQLLEKIYVSPNPGALLGQVVVLAKDYVGHEAIDLILKRGFDLFFRNVISKYQIDVRKLHLCGSVAFHFSDWIKEAAADNQFEIGNIIQNPIEGLVSYHSRG